MPLVILAGKEYGSGSSRDWAAKGTALLGVRAVIAESFERIHRSNLVGMGVLPLQFADGESARIARASPARRSSTITGLAGARRRDARDVTVTPSRADGTTRSSRRGAHRHAEGGRYYRHGGILQYVLRQLMASA